MESSNNNTFGTQNTGSTGTTGTSAAGIGGSAAGSDTGFSRDAGSDASGLADRAKSAAGAAGDKLGDVGSTVREKAGSFKNTLADALESGAERLRQQGTGGQTTGAAATGGSTGVVADDNRLAQTSNQIAGGMQGAADWLRDADLDGLKTGLEKQVKEHPGRTLAVAVGVGYLLGKAFRK
jgi:ElaB/YqjD/DUF883 family membrane-anchored ribosome-binding protein